MLTYPNPILKKKSVKVEKVTSELQGLADDMLETMYSSNGVGLAAPQIGKNIRMIVVDTQAKDEDGKLNSEEMTELENQVSYPLVLINPEIVKREGTIKWEEGCLSVPGYTEEVTRSKTIEVKYLDKAGSEQSLYVDGLLSVCIQHEIDHLDGKLFIEKLSSLRMNRIKAKIKKYGYPVLENQENEV